MPTAANIAIDKRLERVAGFCGVCSCGWGCFAIYFTHRDLDFSASLCASEAYLTLMFALAAYKFPSTRWAIAVVNILLCGFGLTLECAASDTSTSTTLPYFCGLGVMATHQLGRRWAACWVLLSAAIILLLLFTSLPTLIPTERMAAPLDDAIKLIGLVTMMTMIAQQAECSSRQYERQLVDLTKKLGERTYSLSLAEEVAKVGHWRWDGTSQEILLSNEAKQMCYIDGDSFPLSLFLERFAVDDRRRLDGALRSASTRRMAFEFDLTIQYGGIIKFVQCIGGPAAGPLSDSNSEGSYAVFGVLKDVTESRNIQSELSRKANALYELAEFDQLTGLANRYRFKKKLIELAAACHETGTEMVLIMIDLDGFKEVNDSIGHAGGDVLLQEVARRLSEVTRQDDIVSRLGGDEFTVLLSSADSGRREDVTGDMASALGEPFVVEGQEVRLGASMGVAVYPDHATSTDELTSFADRAMYVAKTSGASAAICVYEPWMTEEVCRRRELEKKLAWALHNREFHLVYQPQISAVSGRVCGVEALLRWTSDGVLISPAEFVPLLESTRIIISVGRWVLSEACRQAQMWKKQGFDLRMSVNVSPIQFNDRDFANDVLEALNASELPARLLDLEVTEGVLIDGLEKTREKLGKLKDLGAHISIDDFGTGYSSLSYLKHLPINRLKIDRAFVKDIPDNDDGVIASAVIVLAKSLGMSVLAEGVETVEQKEFLTERGCEEFQGFYFAKPLRPDECLKFFQQTSIHVEPIASGGLADSLKAEISNSRSRNSRSPVPRIQTARN